MRHEGIANPEQLSILSKVPDVYCQRAGIVADAPERTDIATRILLFYDLGLDTEDDLADALERRVGSSRKRLVAR